MWLLLIAPMIISATVGWLAVGLIHLWSTRKGWQPLGNPPGLAVAFYEDTSNVVSTDGQVYHWKSDSGGWRQAYRSDLHSSSRASG